MTTSKSFLCLLSRRSNKAQRRNQQVMNLELLEQRLALSTVSGLVADTAPPIVRSVALPMPKTYGTGSVLIFKLNFNEPVRVVGNQADVYLPVEVGYATTSTNRGCSEQESTGWGWS